MNHYHKRGFFVFECIAIVDYFRLFEAVNFRLGWTDTYASNLVGFLFCVSWLPGRLASASDAPTYGINAEMNGARQVYVIAPHGRLQVPANKAG